MSKKSYYSKEWEDAERFPQYCSWIRPVANDINSFGCSICGGKSIALSNMGVRALESHCKGKKHVMAVESIRKSRSLKSLFTQQPQQQPISETQKATSSGSNLEEIQQTQLLSTSKSQQLISNFTSTAEVTKAEVIWCMRMVMQHYSYNSCKSLNEIFRTMFADSSIAQKFKLGADKAGYIIAYGLAPYFSASVINRLKEPIPVQFSSCFDESLNSVVTKGQFDVHVIYFDEVKKEVSRNYIGSSFLGHASTSDLKTAFLKVHSDLDITHNLIQLGMDGPNVNWSLHKEIVQYKEEVDPSSPKLLEIGSCSLHVMHGAYKDGQKAVKWNMDKFLRSCYYLFKDSPARRSDYLIANGIADEEDHSPKCVFPKKFVGHRWLENGCVIARLIQIIEKLLVYVQFVLQKPKSKQPKSESFQTVVAHTTGDENLIVCRARLEFSKYICETIEPFLIKFQSEMPLAIFLYEESWKLLHSLLSMFITKEILDAVKSPSKVCSIDLSETSNHKDGSAIDIGFGAKKMLSKMSPQNKLQFRVDCKHFLIAVCKKILDRSPLKYRLASSISALSPFVIMKSSNISLARMDTLLSLLLDANHITVTIADEVKRQFKELIQSTAFLREIEAFDITEMRIDSFYYRIVGSTQSFSSLWVIIKLVLTISHGNARVEAGFSINNDLLLPNLKERSVVSQRLVYDAVHHLGGPLQVPFTKELMQSVKMARQRYQTALDEARISSAAKDGKRQERKRLMKELENLESSKAKLIKTTNDDISSISERIFVLKNNLSVL